MILTIYLKAEEINKWATLVGEIVELGTTHRKSLENTIGELSVSQTSTMGRSERSMSQPLYTWPNAQEYVGKLDPYTIDVPSWRAASLRASRPRAVFIRPSAPNILIRADATTSTRILAATAAPAKPYKSPGPTDQCFDGIPDIARGGVFSKRTEHIFKALRR